MTRPEECSVIQDVLKLLANDGFDGLGEAIRRIINEAMLARIETPPFCDMRWRPVLSH